MTNASIISRLRARAIAANQAGRVDDQFVRDVFVATDDACGWYNEAIDAELRAVGA